MLISSNNINMTSELRPMTLLDLHYFSLYIVSGGMDTNLHSHPQMSLPGDLRF